MQARFSLGLVTGQLVLGASQQDRLNRPTRSQESCTAPLSKQAASTFFSFLLEWKLDHVAVCQLAYVMDVLCVCVFFPTRAF